jgi:hypothetical protein
MCSRSAWATAVSGSEIRVDGGRYDDSCTADDRTRDAHSRTTMPSASLIRTRSRRRTFITLIIQAGPEEHFRIVRLAVPSADAGHLVERRRAEQL